MSDEYDLVFEGGGIDRGLLAALDLFLGRQQVPYFVGGERAPAVENAGPLIVDERCNELAVPPLVVGIGDALGDEWNTPMAGHDFAAVQDHVVGTRPPGNQRRSDPERSHEAVALPDEGRHPSRRTV